MGFSVLFPIAEVSAQPVGLTDFFTEQFSASDNDLDFTRLNFIPNGSPNYTSRNFYKMNNNFETDFNHVNYRIPDYGGLVYWNDVMRDTYQVQAAALSANAHAIPELSALSAEDRAKAITERSRAAAKTAVVRGFLGSPEWQQRIGQLNDEEYVFLLYENILGRTPELAGYAYHLKNLQSRFSSRESLAVQFLDSPEAAAVFREETLVVMCYYALMNREATREDFMFHMRNLTTGHPTLGLINNFIYSFEYSFRLDNLGCTFP